MILPATASPTGFPGDSGWPASPGELGYASSSMKAAMRQAGKSGARYAIIIGSDELARNVCAVKNMDNGNQEEVAVENLASYISTKD